VSAAAVLRSALVAALTRYRRSRGLWLLLLLAPVSARYWIGGKSETYAAVVIDGKAPTMTSSVLGVSLGIVVSVLVVPLAFVFLRANAARRQPWQIEDVTPASRTALALGRFGADVAVFAALLAAMTLAGWVLAWAVEPVDGVRPGAVALGLWLIAMPTLMLVAALRALFDALPPTRGAFGEFAFLCLWIVSLALSSSSVQARAAGWGAAMSDVFGMIGPIAAMFESGGRTTMAIGGAPVGAGWVAVDTHSGLLARDYLASRLSWAGIAVALAAVAGAVYRPRRPGKGSRLRAWIARAFAPGPPPAARADAPAARAARWRWPGVFAAEFASILPGRPGRALACGAALLACAADFDVLAAPAIGLLLIFGACAQAGRSERPGLLALTRTMAAPPYLRRAWFVAAGVAWALLLAAPAIVAASARGDAAPLATALTGGAAICTVAMALAAWTGSAFAARLMLLIAWYAWLTAP